MFGKKAARCWMLISLLFCRCSYSRRFVAERVSREEMLHTVLRQALYLDFTSSLGWQTVEWKKSRLMHLAEFLLCVLWFSSAGACSLSRGRVERNGQVVLRVLSIYFKDTCDQTVSWQGAKALHSICVKASEGLRRIATSVAFLRLLSLPEPLHVLTNTKG